MLLIIVTSKVPVRVKILAGHHRVFAGEVGLWLDVEICMTKLVSPVIMRISNEHRRNLCGG